MPLKKYCRQVVYSLKAWKISKDRLIFSHSARQSFDFAPLSCKDGRIADIVLHEPSLLILKTFHVPQAVFLNSCIHFLKWLHL